jgi:hypothetical protein
MVSQSSFDLSIFGPCANPFQAYFTSLESLSQGLEPMKGPMKSVARCQLEVMGLVSRRAQAVMEIPSRIAQCRTPQDLVNEQARFWTTAFEQCSESSRRIMEAWGQMAMAPAGFADTSGRTERDYISFPSPKDANGQGGAQGARGPRRRVA